MKISFKQIGISLAEKALDKTSRAIGHIQKSAKPKDKETDVSVKVLRCPCCGADIKKADSDVAVLCEYCGTKLYISDNTVSVEEVATASGESVPDVTAPDPYEEEISRIKIKYSEKTINPFKRKKNRRLMEAEIDEVLRRKAADEAREEKREKIIKTIESVKANLKINKQLYLSLALVILLAFSGGMFIHLNTTSVHNITFNVADEYRNVGDFANLSYTVEPSTAKYNAKDIELVFENQKIKYHNDSAYKYECFYPGTTEISIKYKGKIYDTKTVVINEVLATEIYHPSITVGRGNTVLISPTIRPYNTTNKVFTSTIDDTEIATASDSTIKGIKVGQTTLHLFLGTLSCDVEINVVEIEPSSISIRGLKEQYISGDTDSGSVDFYPFNTTLRTVKWTSSDSKVLSVDSDGNITANAQGSAILTASFNDSVKDSIEIIVKYPDPVSIEISGSDGKLDVGKSVKLSVSFTPENVSDETITWESSNTDVAEVSSDGTVTGKRAGNTTITATTVNGKIASIEINVKEVYVDPHSIVQSYIINTNPSSKKFHLPGCYDVSKMKEENKWYVKASWYDIVSWGYEPCQHCHP